MGKDASRIRHDPVTQADLDRYAAAEQQLGQMQAPILLRHDNPHQRLYVAAMDGTGNSIYQDNPETWSAVGKIHEQLEELRRNGVSNIRSGYVEGIGTQESWLPKKWDGWTGHSFEQRVETAYRQFCVQAKRWLEEDPNAEISVAAIGFSRGAELAAALTRVIHERGIMDPDTAVINAPNGIVTHAVYRDQLVPPGNTRQAVMLFDPVATGITEHDRRLPPSVVGGFQIMSQDRRDQFKGNYLIPEGMTEANRFLSITVPGAHSDVGNSYPRNGLGILSANLGIDFLNSLSDRDFLTKQAVPQDPAQYVIHRSEDHSPIWTTRGFRDGQRDFIEQPGPARQCRIEPQPDCTRKAPVDPVLDAQVERQPVRIQPADSPPRLQTDVQSRARDPIEDMFMRMTDAAMRNDSAGMLGVGREYARSPQGQSWLQQGREYHHDLAVLEKAQAEQLAQQQQQAEIQRGPVMRV
ncbi:phospholipase effector Tle1 domain-containing protein [Luteimonas sp. e5]